MNGERKEKLSAWLDGELTEAERAAFEAGIPKETVEGEKRLDAALACKLGAAAACPDALWRRLELQMRNTEPGATPAAAAKRHPVFAWRIAAAAAVAVAAFGLFVMQEPPKVEAAFLELHERSWQELARTSAISADSCDAALEYLTEQGFAFKNLPVDRFDPSRNDQTYVIGVRTVDYKGEPVGELLFNCCEKPMMIVFVRKGGSAATALERVRENIADYPHVNTVEPVCGGRYIAAVVGPGASPYLCSFLRQHATSGE